jgi:hypothetical protein
MEANDGCSRELLPHFHEVGCVSLPAKGSILRRNLALAEAERLASR